MNLATVDLNLLVAFEALFAERNVTRAARRVGLMQPSMSNTLTRMRDLFSDELFVRTPNGMVPTPRALEIAPSILEALAQLRKVFENGRSFDPGTAERRFTVSVSDYTDLILMPGVIAALRTRAPGIDLRIKPLNPSGLYEDIDSGDVDLAIGGHLPLPARYVGIDLFDERFVCIADPENPVVASGLDVKAYAHTPHILFSRDSASGGVADEVLSAIGLKRRVVVTIPHVMAMPFAIRGTDLLAMIAERVALRLKELAGVTVFPLPLEMPSFSLKLVHSRRLAQDPALVWLKDLICEIASGL